MSHENLPLREKFIEPVYPVTCCACGRTYEDSLGSMIRSCADCTPIVLPYFEQDDHGWTKTSLLACYQAILAAGNLTFLIKAHGVIVIFVDGEPISIPSPILVLRISVPSAWVISIPRECIPISRS